MIVIVLYKVKRAQAMFNLACSQMEVKELEDDTKKVRKLAAMLNNRFISSPKEDNNTKSDYSNEQTVRSPSRVKNMSDRSSSNHATEFQFNSLNVPPQSTSSVFDDGYCIYQTPTPSRINDFTSFSVMAQDGRNLLSRNQTPISFRLHASLGPRYS